MKKIFLTAIAVLTFTMVSAQECCNDSNKQKKECCKAGCDKTAAMAKQLGLTEEQTKQVKELNSKYADLTSRSPRQGRNAGRQEGRKECVDGVSCATKQQRQMPSKEEMQKKRAERKERMDSYNKELKAILTADQYAAYEKDMQAQKENGRHRK